MGDTDSRIDRLLGYGGVVLVVIAVVLTIAAMGTLSNDLGSLEPVVWMLGVIMLAWMIAITVRHVRTHDDGGGRNLLIAGWVSIPVIAGLVMLIGGFSTGENRLGEWVLDLLKSPEAYVMLLGVGLILASVAILVDGVDHEARQLGKVTGTHGWYRHQS